VLAVDIHRFRGYLPTTPLVDLLSLDNPAPDVGGPAQAGAVGLGDPFAFPFQTIESLLVQDRRTLVVANDNDYPFSSGRRPGSPDDNEIIVIRLPEPLPPLRAGR
jgi:glycerophosphoryl diester phosphodiesterase